MGPATKVSDVGKRGGPRIVGTRRERHYFVTLSVTAPSKPRRCRRIERALSCISAAHHAGCAGACRSDGHDRSRSRVEAPSCQRHRDAPDRHIGDSGSTMPPGPAEPMLLGGLYLRPHLRYSHPRKLPWRCARARPKGRGLSIRAVSAEPQQRPTGGSNPPASARNVALRF